MTRRAWPCLAAIGLAAAPAGADQVHFTGRTTASATLIHDTLQAIARAAYAKTGCRTLGAVEAEILPPGYVPSDPRDRLGEGQRTYERWTATLCGQTVKYLITFWPAADGGTMFGISDPYPPEAP